MSSRSSFPFVEFCLDYLSLATIMYKSNFMTYNTAFRQPYAGAQLPVASVDSRSVDAWMRHSRLECQSSHVKSPPRSCSKEVTTMIVTLRSAHLCQLQPSRSGTFHSSRPRNSTQLRVLNEATSLGRYQLIHLRAKLIQSPRLASTLESCEPPCPTTCHHSYAEATKRQAHPATVSYSPVQIYHPHGSSPLLWL